ncbi:MAG: FCD domain-containing protein [Roseibium sp.]|uniref:FadR/GntR family transcriptional regulator n=1 Tax=Roseibium sp. TaxID=1936156 RepID=UPI00263674DF|nr:FCD domain-containing protein [Roseibium sp.]MCV0428743.1 FCD domain-containing protein [Roseibium sp.]
MNKSKLFSFELPDKVLTSLPTGAVKDTVEHLGQRIARGHYKMGAILPKEDEFVDALGVSRTVVREAIKVLCGKGLVRTARRYGSRVCHFDDWNLLDPDVIRWHDADSPLTARIYSEATDLRLIFEPEAAALAALNANSEQRNTILAAAQSLQPEDDDSGLIGADYAFHATILQASGNLMLAQLQNLIYAVLIFSYSAGRKGAPDELVSRNNHIDVAEAIVAGDADLARNLMRDMLMQNKSIAEKIASVSAAH